MIALKKLGLLEDGYAFSCPATGMTLRDAVPTGLHMLISAQCTPTESTKDKQTSRTFDEQGWGFAEAALLSAAITKRLTDYKTTVSEDNDLLLSLCSSPSVSLPRNVSCRRYLMAIKVRESEKEIMFQLYRMAQEHIATKTHELANAAKRQKNKEHSPPSRPLKLRRRG